MDALRATPISTPDGHTQTLGNLATIKRATGPANITHFNVARTFDVQANVDDTDLGSVSDAIDELVASARTAAPMGTRITAKGQVESMNSSFGGARGARVRDPARLSADGRQLPVVARPFIILMALRALAGIVWILFLSGRRYLCRR
jgi:multidrug efflux pump subunit AcrB